MHTNKIVVGVVLLLGILGLASWYGVGFDSSETENYSYSTAQGNQEINQETDKETDNMQERNLRDTAVGQDAEGENPVVVLKTNKGEIAMKLYMDQTPITAGNFLELVESGFYDGVKFHRVIEGFMIQSGDPNSKTDDESTYGSGGPGYTIIDEFAPGLSNTIGTLSMANAGPNTGGSQFFINTADNTFLDGKHAVFGEVVGGINVVWDIDSTETKEGDIPVEPVTIEKAELKAAVE